MAKYIIEYARTEYVTVAIDADDRKQAFDIADTMLCNDAFYGVIDEAMRDWWDPDTNFEVWQAAPDEDGNITLTPEQVYEYTKPTEE